jgi:hypothetical protein
MNFSVTAMMIPPRLLLEEQEVALAPELVIQEQVETPPQLTPQLPKTQLRQMQRLLKKQSKRQPPRDTSG